MSRPKWPLVGALLALLGFSFLLIGVLTHAGWLSQLDHGVVSAVTSLRPRWLTAIMLTVTTLGNATSILVLSLILGVVLLATRHLAFAGLALMNVAGLAAINHVLKTWVQRPRPFKVDTAIHPLVHVGGWSFPSGHSSGAMLFYGVIIIAVLLYVHRRYWRRGLIFWGGLMILATGYSRIYVQVHYPSDVLGGFAIALAWLLLLWWWGYPWLSQEKKAAATRLN